MNKEELVSLMEQEGDFEEFEYKGLHCVIQRNRGKCWCGYVALTPNEALYGFDYDSLIPITEEAKSRKVDIDRMDVLLLMAYTADPNKDLSVIPVSLCFDIHGGITYSANHLIDSRTIEGIIANIKEGENLWWFGFDCGHAGDLVPRYITEELPEDLQVVYGLQKVLTNRLNQTNGEVYRTKEYAINETKLLAEQLSKFKFNGKK